MEKGAQSEHLSVGRLAVLLLALFTYGTLVSNAQKWRELGPTAPQLTLVNNVPKDWVGIGRVNCLAISPTNPDLMFMGTARGGIWKTADAGANWTHVNIPKMRALGISDIVFAPSDANILYAGTGDAMTAFDPDVMYDAWTKGVIKSTDGGTSWDTTAFNYYTDLYSGSISRVWVDPINPETVIIFSNVPPFVGIWRTANGGKTWEPVDFGNDYLDFAENPGPPRVFHASTYSSQGFAGVLSSSDDGMRWDGTGEDTPAGRIRFAVTKANTTLLLEVSARADNGSLDNIRLSRDAGVSFDTIPTMLNLLGGSSNGSDTVGVGMYALAAAISPTNENEWYIGGVNVWRTTNAGVDWILSSDTKGVQASWLPPNQQFLKFHPTRDILYAGHDGGLSQSADEGVTWKDISKGLRIQHAYRLSVSNGNPNLTLSGGTGSGTTLSTDGESFRAVLPNDCFDNAIDPNNAQVLYSGATNGTFRRSDNGGSTWQVIASPAAVGDGGSYWIAPIVTDPTISGILYIGYSRVHKSTNYGATWVPMQPLPAPSGYISHIAISPSNSNYVYLATTKGLYSTKDEGMTWAQLADVKYQYIRDLIVHPKNPQQIWIAPGGPSVTEITAGVEKRIDGFSLGFANALQYCAGDPGRLFVGTDQGLFVKDDDGKDLMPYGVDFLGEIISDIEFVPSTSTIRVATVGRGIWEVPLKFCEKARPTITALTPTTVCFGDTVILEAPPGLVHIWSNGTSKRRVVLTETDQGGLFSVFVGDSAGCAGRTDSVVVIIKRRPPRPTIVREGEALVSSELEAIGFQWYVDGVPIAGATQRTFTIPSDKNASISVETFNVHDCPSPRSEPWSAGPVSVDEKSENWTMVIRPNPTESDITIDLPNGSNRALEILDIRGTVVLMQDIDDLKQTTTIALTDLPSGSYFVRIRAGASMWMSKLILAY